MEASIQIEVPDQPEVRALLAESDAFYAALYPSESNHLLDVASLLVPGVAFHVVRIDGRVVGFGAVVLRADAEYGELKRIYLAPKARGHRIGRRMMDALEAFALANGVTVLRLETGINQPEALNLFRSSGYRKIGPFGSYRLDPLSVFLEKRLERANRERDLI
jgi:putative acetyltransferase